MARISGDASDRPMGERPPNTHRVIKERANEDQEDRSFRGGGRHPGGPPPPQPSPPPGRPPLPHPARAGCPRGFPAHPPPPPPPPQGPGPTPREAPPPP